MAKWEGGGGWQPLPFIMKELRVKVRGNGNIVERLGLRMWDLHLLQRINVPGKERVPS